MQNVAY